MCYDLAETSAQASTLKLCFVSTGVDVRLIPVKPSTMVRVHACDPAVSVTGHDQSVTDDL